MRFAVLDLGSNTFHLLIVDIDHDGHLETIFRERQYVKLASGGINKIESSAYQRAVSCLRDFKEKMDEYDVVRSQAFGTATLRSADNGPQFVEQIKEDFGIEIQTISGKEEARLIAKGVMYATHLSPQAYLIMDIGGGSVEFIVIANNEVQWAESYNIGISILKNKFHHHDPIRGDEINDIEMFLKEQIPSLAMIQEKYGPFKALIGASGSFEVLQAILHPPLQEPAFYEMDSESIKSITNDILALNHDQRLEHPLIPTERADLIVVALVLMRFVLNRTHIQHILVSEYALKEGAILDMLED